MSRQKKRETWKTFLGTTYVKAQGHKEPEILNGQPMWEALPSTCKWEVISRGRDFDLSTKVVCTLVLKWC